ncbi:hypothetical protein [Acidovorax sp.]|uniref:hypothetical protein n=1 Tax=Acidovorax sp. TaxID=1872122 RepID=UPI00391DED71
MQLTQIIASLNSFDDELCIVARRPWTAEAEARLVPLGDDGRIPAAALAEGYEYFLEVGVAIDEVIGELQGLSAEQRVALCIFYAENDAYPEWLNQAEPQRHQ